MENGEEEERDSCWDDNQLCRDRACFAPFRVPTVFHHQPNPILPVASASKRIVYVCVCVHALACVYVCVCVANVHMMYTKSSADWHTSRMNARTPVNPLERALFLSRLSFVFKNEFFF